ncbi:serine/threonine-protein kinase [Yinghuangia soli]|uniref:Serine/threonine protein kinase n=1 Tax=Yinghuangia soli TaxID=2908204 RepID=A0AA41U0U4_9ACTN|nr:serine/threonine-protein kinase [Yinghuangia soli]MCF2526787.1 serine/threonine protein kinase [Yinghuangia soli]
MAAEAGAGIRPLGDADPRSVGPYRLTGRLGSGGMGTVFAGVDHFDRRVAIKIVHAQFADDREFRARFTREVALLRRVQGTCTTPVLDADVDAVQPWFACEYVPGPTLAERVERQGPMRGDELFALAAGLAEALVALHAVGIVHRDLKPQNVVCSPAGPRVLDLGIARSMEDSGLTRTGMMIGSPAWMSPERFRGQNSTPAADVYAWAMMVAYAATGVIPFGTGAPEVVAMRVLQEHADTSGVPQALRGIVDWSADKDPLRRPAAPDLLANVTHAWRGTLGAAQTGELDPVSDATSLIHLHWNPQAGAPAGGQYAPPPPQAAYGAPMAQPGTGYPAQGHGVAGDGMFADNLFRDDGRAPAPQAAGMQAADGYGGTAGYPMGGPSAEAPAEGGASAPYQLSDLAEAPPAGRRRGGSRRKLPLKPLIAAAAVVAVVATAAVLMANSGGDGKKKKDPVAPAAKPSDTPPPGTVTGPGTFNLQGVKFQVPAGWDARPMSGASACVAPLELPVATRTDCLKGGLRVWVGNDASRVIALDKPAGWTLGAAEQCPAGGTPMYVTTSGKKFEQLGSLRYEYAQYQVSCPDDVQLQPQVWWLPTSKISFSTGGLPKSYDQVVKALIAGMDRAGYKSPKS